MEKRSGHTGGNVADLYIMGEKIMFGHSNMDLDCFGSLSMARYLYPGHLMVRSGRIHPVAKNLYTVYRDHLEMIAAKELKKHNIDEVVIMDTRQYDRVKEYFRFLPDFSGTITVYDHHCETDCDIPGASVYDGDFGANTSMLCMELLKRDIHVDENDATIALAGIYADTGNFSHGNVTGRDFQAAQYLMEHGASLNAVGKLLSKLREEHQVSLFHRLLNTIQFHNIQGYSIITSWMKLEGQMAGLAAVIERIFEVEDADAYIAVFELEKEGSHLLIGRAGNPRIDLNIIMNSFGGAGHPQAASALIKNSSGFPIYAHLLNMLEQRLKHALTSMELMREAVTIPRKMTLLDSALRLEESGNSGAPVVDEDERLVGMITLRDIQKGRKAGQMNAPVHAYMTRNVIHADRNTTIREIEQMFYRHDIGHLPILEDEKVVGQVTRSDYIKFLQNNGDFREIIPQE